MLTEEAIPTEEAEDFSEPSAAGAAEPEIDVPEPDMEQAPDFWSDALEVSPADVPPDAAVEAIGAEDDASVAAPAQPDDGERRELPQPEGAIPYRPEDDAPPPEQRVPTRPGLMTEGAERRAFFGLDFRGLDRNLSQRER